MNAVGISILGLVFSHGKIWDANDGLTHIDSCLKGQEVLEKIEGNPP